MSRVGKTPIDIPKGVTVNYAANSVTIEGPKGKLIYKLKDRFSVELKDNTIIVKCPSEDRHDMAIHGLTRTLIKNMVIGVTQGYSKELEIRGVGFKAAVQGKRLTMQLGYSHPIIYDAPDGIIIQTPKPTQVHISGIDKAKVGEVAADIRKFYKPEPYKGKGIRYVGEYVRHKAGKTVA